MVVFDFRYMCRNPNAQLKNVDLVQYCGIQYLVLWRKKHYNQNARFGAILKR